MNDSHIVSLKQLKEFLKVGKLIQFQSFKKKEKYEWINKVLTRFQYFKLRKRDKGILREYIASMSGISQSQLTRLINRKKKLGYLQLSSTKRYTFPRKYTQEDIDLLIKTDNLHLRLSGQATKNILKREYEVFRNEEYGRIKDISVPHIYNLRETKRYLSLSLTIKKTNPVNTNIGERRKPNNHGIPGYLRIDTVHQGDKDKEKGVYHINIVDEITQWEIVGCVEKISEYYLLPLLKKLLEQIPFKVINFHSDNGSEFINRLVAKLLNKLLIEQTKSRARHCNDNALVESKNGSIIRKQMGHIHISQENAGIIDEFYQKYLNIYLNYHRPCGFATTIIDKRGKEKKIYKNEDYKTPYEKLKSLGSKYLKDNISFKELDKIAYQFSDNEFAEILQKQKVGLFKNIKKKSQEMINLTSNISCSYVD